MTGNPAALARRARKQRFTNIVRRSVSSLPIDVQRMLDNVAIVVEDEPGPSHFDDLSEQADGDEVFGLYQGIPRTERDSGYTIVTPDRITIFAGPLERACETQAELIEQVRITVLHELGHHLGFDEGGLDAIGLS
jgi:predicted Zn-dependent protease with MMP-like domain